MCLAACAVCWGLVFLWQADVKQFQCNAYPWVVYLPASYLVNLNNVKAYRLSTFLNAGDKRPKPFSHGKVMKMTLKLTLLTVLVLLVCLLTDPLQRVVVVADAYRPSLNRYHCQSGTITTALLYVLVIGHIVTSVFCIIEVRNGFEAFRDGMVIKEAFIILYSCLLVATIMQNLGLNATTTYLVRTACMSLGVTLFCVRILISRCAKYWIPQRAQEHLYVVHGRYLQPLFQNFATSTTHGGHELSRIASSNFLGDQLDPDPDNDSPLYNVEVPAENNLAEMTKVLMDPQRSLLFESIAKHSLCLENLTFLKSVMKYQTEAEEELVRLSIDANSVMKDNAKKIIEMHISCASEEEVNVSSRTRAAIEKNWKEWDLHYPLLTTAVAKQALEDDKMKRAALFEPAFKEISIMLYQNLWNKFRSAETTEQMATGRAKGNDTIFRA